METQKIFQNLKNKIYFPVYFLYGEEPFYIDEITRYIENNIIEESNRDFNQTVIYGRDVSAKDIVDISLRFPMMGNYQLVIVKEAQNIKNLEPIENYVKKPMASTILVINYKYRKLDKRKTLYKTLNQSNDVVLFESPKLYDNKIPQWINDRVKLNGNTISPQSSMLLAEYLGNDLSKINNELSKLFINIKPGETISTEHIEKNIGISKDYNIFEFTKAIGFRNIGKAIQIIDYFESNPSQNPLMLIIPTLNNYFMKIFVYQQISHLPKNKIASALGINSYFLNEYSRAAKNYPAKRIPSIIEDIYQLDLKSKGVGSSESTSYGPLKEFVLKLFI